MLNGLVSYRRVPLPESANDLKLSKEDKKDDAVYDVTFSRNLRAGPGHLTINHMTALSHIYFKKNFVLTKLILFDFRDNWSPSTASEIYRISRFF